MVGVHGTRAWWQGMVGVPALRRAGWAHGQAFTWSGAHAQERMLRSAWPFLHMVGPPARSTRAAPMQPSHRRGTIVRPRYDSEAGLRPSTCERSRSACSRRRKPMPMPCAVEARGGGQRGGGERGGGPQRGGGHVHMCARATVHAWAPCAHAHGGGRGALWGRCRAGMVHACVIGKTTASETMLQFMWAARYWP